MDFGRRIRVAVMHPADIENYSYTPTEKQMYEAFRDQLAEKYQVFYSIRWFETDENNKRVDSECDFLIFDPSFGFLTVEVKGGTGIEVDEDGHWQLNENYDGVSGSVRKLKCSPYEQAEKSMRHFYNYFMSEFSQRFTGTYGFAVAFPRYTGESVYSVSSPRELTIDVNDMGNIAQRINEIFHYWKNQRNLTFPFSNEQKTRFINCINKRISLSAAAGALIKIKEKEFAQIDFMQDSILDVLFHYHQVRVLGGAGTGKTFIAMKKALRDEKVGKTVLFLCCSSELSDFVKYKLNYESSIDFFTYDNLVKEVIGGETFDKIGFNKNGNRACFDFLVDVPLYKKYDSIIVDEGQDFDEDMGLTVRLFLKDESRSDLYVFYDINQNVFHYKSENAFSIEYPPFILRYNIRNTGLIYKYAVDNTGLGRDTIANQLLGVKPDIRKNNNSLQTLKDLSNIVTRLTKKEYVSNKSIVILSDESFETSVLSSETRIGSYNISFKPLEDTDDSEICFKTAEQFKGLEADVVIYLKNQDEEKVKDEIDRSREYVALTRARYYLYVLYTYHK